MARASFSRIHWARMPSRFSFISAASTATTRRRVLLALSVSFLSACSSICSCVSLRSTLSISTGIESISILILEAASSTRSMALSGRNRSVM